MPGTLRVITGKARSGKTAKIISEIADAVRSKKGGRILIVPEQYSHEAERELCRVCGDSASLYAEALSFTGLARNIAAETGGSNGKYLDNGGRLLCMARALSLVKERLSVYGTASRRAELQAMLLSAVDELKTACVSAEQLEAAAESIEGPLADKLRDLALVAETYNTVAAGAGLDPGDRLTELSERISKSSLGPDSYVYVDGFSDFTAQELAVLEQLLRKGVQLSVCLTLDSAESANEVFGLSRITAQILKDRAEELGISPLFVQEEGSAPDSALSFFADNMFGFGGRYASADGTHVNNISLVSAGSVVEECEFAASKAIELVRAGSCRWRDIAIAVRNFEDYRTALEGTFEFYGVPLFTTRKSTLLSRPLPSLISSAYRIVTTGWEVDDLTAFMRTGLTGLDSTECDTLENYIFLWQLHGNTWKGRDDWRQHPAGYGKKPDKESNAQLTVINELRRRLARPLISFENNSSKAYTGAQHCEALAQLFKDLRVPQQLEKRAAALKEAGELRLADEYSQLWKLIVSALEQAHSILGDSEINTEDFSRLFEFMLSGYDIGTIPVSLDRVSAGDFDRMRRRSIRHLIVLGAEDSRLPARTEESGVFSGEERKTLIENDIRLSAGDAEIWREFSLVYNCISLPSESLTMVWPVAELDGSGRQPSFIVKRAMDLFGIEAVSADMEQVRLSARGPALTAAAEAVRKQDRQSDAGLKAAAYFKNNEPERWQHLVQAGDAAMKQRRLSENMVKKLYGSSFRLGATKVERFADCSCSFFCEFGLRAAPHKAAEFSAMEMGTFMHYVMENVARDVKAEGGFAAVEDERISALAEKYIEEYKQTELDGLREKSDRFIFIFNRLANETRRAIADLAREMRVSGFVPFEFELNFGDLGYEDKVCFGNGENVVELNGIADRVDGWIDGDRLYVRVADYKSGTKKFSFSDAYNGKGLQMLLYLFALARRPELMEDYRKNAENISEVVPAGVMYVPLNRKYETVDNRGGTEKGLKEIEKKARRSGMVLREESVMSAWDNSEEKIFTPVNPSPRANKLEAMASSGQLNALEGHIEEFLSEVSKELRSGSIAVNPRSFDGKKSACEYCDYASFCGIDDSPEIRLQKMKKYKADEVWNLLGVGETNDNGKEEAKNG